MRGSTGALDQAFDQPQKATETPPRLTLGITEPAIYKRYGAHMRRPRR